MQVHQGVGDLPLFKNAVITVGSFDGLHQGHQVVLSKLLNIARQVNGESVVITFDPHPRHFLYPQKNDFKLLSSKKEKIDLIAAQGIDHLVFVPFTADFAQQSADEYLHDFLFSTFNPHTVVIGFDHRYGKDRSGDIKLLKEAAHAKGIAVIIIEKEIIDKLKISSTEVRKLIGKGNVTRAHKLLGRPYSLHGTIYKGDQIGRTIGFPTANIKLDDERKLCPPYGIYAAEIHLNGKTYGAMGYLGKRPVLDGQEERIEFHIFDFDQNIYGIEVSVDFLRYVREDQVFTDLNGLKQQLQKDEISVRALLEKKTALVILNYNGLNHLRQYLDDILLAKAPRNELIIIDNASTDDSVTWLKHNHPEIRIISLEKNLGFAGGYTEGLKQIEADFYVLINSDLSFATDWYNTIIQQMALDPHIAAAQPKICSMERPTHFEYAGAAGGLLDRWAYPFCYGRVLDMAEEDRSQYDKSKEIFWSTGAAMVVRAEVFKEFGGFDASFFAHQEEIDLCWRLKRAGYKIMSFPEVKVFHLGGGTLSYGSPFKVFLNFRNSLWMIIKNEEKPLFHRLLWRFILDCIATIKFVLSGHLKLAAMVIKAHFQVLKSLPYRLRQRKELQDAIEQKKIGPPNVTGRINKSIVVNYYLKRKRTSFEILEGES